jgi:cytochrome c oxidase subunit 4
MDDTTTAGTTTATAPGELAPAPGHEEAAHGDVGRAHGHPGPAKYVGIAVILAVVTGIEVALYYLHLPSGVLVALLLGLALIKFSMVAAYFMHLKFDSHLLRRVFVTGILLALAVYTVALVTLGMLLG